MSQLATKPTYKKKKFNKQRVASQLDTLVENVSKRGIFVIQKDDRYYQVKNYLTNQVLLDFIPTKHIAERLCNKYNNNRLISHTWKQKVTELLGEYSKLDQDCIYYTYTIFNTEDEVTKDVATIRREYASMQIKHVIYKLSTI